MIRHGRALRIECGSGRATGVRIATRAGHIETVAATQEVICCAGAIGSPHLLLLSGIGLAEHLASLGIVVVASLAGVGQNLQDHLGGFGLSARVKDPDLHFPCRDSSFKQLYDHFQSDGCGPLSTNNLEAGAFVRTSPQSDYPDTQLFLVTGLPGDYCKEGDAGSAHFYLSSYVGRPKSHGSVSFQSNYSTVPPLIDPDYLSHPDDLVQSIKGIRKNLDVLSQTGFDRVRAPGNYQFSNGATDAILEAFVPRNATTVWHPTSTCAMGVGDEAVVDTALKTAAACGTCTT